MKVAICGIGRIGRCLIRIILEKYKNFNLSYFIDIEDDLDNISYLLNHDTTYGWLDHKFTNTKETFKVGTNKIRFIQIDDYSKLNWSELEFDILIDSSGVNRDWSRINELCNEHNKKVIITHHPKNFSGSYFVEGISIDSIKSKVISASICDSVGIAPVLSIIDNFEKISNASIVSLHPWLSYQNLVDGSVRSISNPGHNWNDYALGRASTESLIPKQTSIKEALRDLLPDHIKISAMSFRTPTSIVTSAILHINFQEKIDFSESDIINLFNKNSLRNFIDINYESLVSIDFRKRTDSSIIDERFIEIIDKKTLRVILWYDNEWGYSSSIMRRIQKIYQN